MNDSKNKRIKQIFIVIAAIFALSVFFPGSAAGEENGEALVTLSYVNEVLKPQIVQEVLSKIGAGGQSGTGGSAYADIRVESGKTIVLGADCEFIYRGGGAVAITSSAAEGYGVTDISAGREIFSGVRLEFGHVYHASDTESEKYILITGESAYFTIRGSYEII